MQNDPSRYGEHRPGDRKWSTISLKDRQQNPSMASKNIVLYSVSMHRPLHLVEAHRVSCEFRDALFTALMASPEQLDLSNGT
jgi:hypothetical protein